MKPPARRNSHALPAFIKPCLASIAASVPTGADWVHEVKFDGYRLQARLADGKARLLTRSGLDWTSRFDTVAVAIEGLRLISAVFDGEVIVEDERGVPSFARLVDDLRAGHTSRMTFVTFDLLFLNGESLLHLPLTDRKDLLIKVLKPLKKSAPIKYSQHIAGDGTKLLQHSCALGMEGIISKRLDRPYRSGRANDWLKIKCILSDEFVIGGYTDSAAQKNAVGALLIGFFRKSEFIYAGRVGTGFSTEVSNRLWRLLQPLRARAQPFETGLDAIQRRGAHWVKPVLVAHVEYRAWTGNGMLRHASFIALRDDKPPRSVGDPRPSRA